MGLRLAKVRKQAGLSQAGMAAALNIALRTYQSYELGVREIPGAIYPRLRRLFQIDAAWVMEGEVAGPARREDSEEVWTRAYMAVHKAISESKADISLEKKLSIVRAVYRELIKTGSVNFDNLSTLVELAS